MAGAAETTETREQGSGLVDTVPMVTDQIIVYVTQGAKRMFWEKMIDSFLHDLTSDDTKYFI